MQYIEHNYGKNMGAVSKILRINHFEDEVFHDTIIYIVQLYDLIIVVHDNIIGRQIEYVLE